MLMTRLCRPPRSRGPSAMTDDEVISAVAKAFGALNAALRALAENGIEVDIEILDSLAITDRATTKMVMARLTRTKTEIDVRV